MDPLYKSAKIIFLCFSFFMALTSNKDVSNNNTINFHFINNSSANENSINNNTRLIKDVLFINGCDEKKLPHPYRYRVLHQMEQLNAAFLESEEYFYLNFEPLIVRDFRIIIFFRCPWTEKVDDAIKLAKKLNKKVLFDIDDLVIDRKYTDQIPFLKSLSVKQKESYDDGVMRMGKTLKLSDGAITTTEALAKELKNYVSKVYINRNVASEEMWKLSQDALTKNNNKTKTGYVIIGYFSGSISHNPDLEMIKPALIKIFKEFKNVQLLLVGELKLPDFLKEFSNRIIYEKFEDWKKLPEIICRVDINIAPIENIIFNSAKSENKWLEAALVKIPTIASNYGAFQKIIKNNKTGLLCSDINDWYISFKTLINNVKLRKNIGENAFNFCKKKYNTIYTGKKLGRFINSIANKHVGFFLPSLQIAGGIYVILKHACILKDEGWDVDLILPDVSMDLFEFENHIFNVISLNNAELTVQYDIIVATLYSTLYSILNYYRTKKYLYLVQGYETDFYPYGSFFRIMAEKTYSVPFGVEYITISKWCENWLWKKYKKKSKYAPNGIDFNNFSHYKRNLNNTKIRILIEGDCNSYYKNVDESFKIIENLDKNKFEVWYLSNNGKPKNWYKIDKFLNKIPFEKVKQIYYECDILLKSSWLESFSYPPLEMMATGGYCIVVPNGGNKEYLKDQENCLFYKLGNIKDAVRNIERLISDEILKENLYKNGLETAKKRNWKYFEKQIKLLYDT